MKAKKTSFEDFEYNAEENYFLHTKSKFCLNADFVLVHGYEEVSLLFAASSGNYQLDEDTHNQLKQVVVETKGL
jgi:hypothetical protein